MKNYKKLVLLFGEYESTQDDVFEMLTNKKTEQSILERTQPTKDKTQTISIISVPSFSSYKKDVEPYICYFKDYQENLQYQLIQLIFCLNFTESINKAVQEILDSLEQQKVSCYKTTITFMITCFDSKQMKDYKFKNNDKATFLILNNKNPQSQVFQWFQEKMKSNNQIWFQLQQQDTQKFNQIQQFESMIQNWQHEFEKNEYQELIQFLTFLETMQEKQTIGLLQDFLKAKNKYSEIQLFFEMILFWSSFNKLIQNYQWKFKKYNVVNFYSNCIACHKCFKFYVLNEQKEFFFTQSLKFQSSEKISERKENRYSYCLDCKEYLKQIVDDFNSLLIKVIIQICFHSYYNFFQIQLMEIEKNGLQSNENNHQQNQIQTNLLEENNKLNKSSDSKIMTNQQKIIDDKIQQNQKETKMISAIMLSCENDEKSFIFTKLYYPIDKNKIKEYKEFKIGNSLLKKFQLIDSPSFQFITDQDQTIAKFKDFFKKFEIHFIFLFVDYQRTDLMKDRINSMLKKLVKIDRSRMAIVITNWQKCVDQEIKAEVEQLAKIKNIENIIFIRQDDKQDQILNQFDLCFENILPTKISFSDTVFAQETEEELLQEKQFDEKLTQFSKQIEEEQKIALQNKFEEQILKEENLENLIKDLEDQLFKRRRELWQLREEKRDTQDILLKLNKQNYCGYQSKNYSSQKSGKRR